MNSQFHDIPIAELLPQQPPFRFVDHLELYGQQETRVSFTPGKGNLLMEDGCLEVSVTDQGKGIENISQAMQPFFTTQPEKERSGMGLSVMQTFMDRVDVESQVGAGTTVRMEKRLREK